ncbi:MAG TPA: energy-coupling factor transporter ATPase [Candidatus Limnocylindrales bacterium]|nr:energy-coupling factor transporter ATPase [Candidatus Limnocylindrales bacterium]
MSEKDLFNTLLEVKKVDYFYAGEKESSTPALSGISLAVNRGEYVAVIGPNGSGKTTLLKLFNALLKPSSGEVLVDGLSTTDDDNIPLIRRQCGMIFQNPDNQLIATTVEEDIAFGLENQALPSLEIQKRVAEVSALLNLERYLKHPPHLLSGGEKQKVAIAGILAMQPQCILMDEPTAMLDPAGRDSVLETVRRLNKEEGTAIVHVTHYVEEAVMADRVVVLDRGKLVKLGPPEDVLTDLLLLHDLGLQGPAAVELSALLREDGFAIPSQLLHNWELVNCLCLSELKI